MGRNLSLSLVAANIIPPVSNPNWPETFSKDCSHFNIELHFKTRPLVQNPTQACPSIWAQNPLSSSQYDCLLRERHYSISGCDTSTRSQTTWGVYMQRLGHTQTYQTRVSKSEDQECVYIKAPRLRITTENQFKNICGTFLYSLSPCLKGLTAQRI